MFKGNKFGTLTARALTRTPKLGVLALGAIEGIDILSDVTLSGYCGALGSKIFGVAGSMLGTGIGNLANNKFNNMLFD